MAKRKHKVGDLIMYTYVNKESTHAHDLGVITKIVEDPEQSTKYYVDWFDGGTPLYLHDSEVDTYKANLNEYKASSR